MHHSNFSRKCLPLIVATLLGATASASHAEPTISRLTPPSNPLKATADTLARFLPGQRFDLQATVIPEAGKFISTVTFAVDGQIVASTNAAGSNAANTSIVAATAINTVYPNAVAASVRAYSNGHPGIHTLTATAVQSDGTSTVATGNFEVVGLTEEGHTVKNIIIMLGDGMGAGHRTAARIMAKGYTQGKAQGRLAMDTFPYTGMVMTSSLNSIVTDSAPGMSNYVSGNKGQNNQEGVFPDDTLDAFDNPRIEYLSEFLHRTKGTSLGIVTTADVFDATPAANAVHTSNRGNGTGIVDQYLDDRKLTGLKVLMGGGRKWFLPNGSNTISPQAANGSQRRTSSDYVLPTDIQAGWGAAAGAMDNARDLISDFQSAGFTYVATKSDLDASSNPDQLLGLFAFSNMNVSFDKINGRRGASTIVNDYGLPDQPMLDEMTEKALRVLSKNHEGFVLMVEGASIDKQAHLMDSDRWIEEVIEFDRAIQKAKDFAAEHHDTLVIVTADHECGGAAIIGASTQTATTLVSNLGNQTAKTMRDNVVGTYDAAKFPKYVMQADGYPLTTDVDHKMLIGYGANADRYETWLSNTMPTQDSQQPFVSTSPLNTYPANASVRNATTGYLVTGQVPGDQAVHTATDIPLSAYGRGASLFTGVMDNTDVFFKLGQAALGGTEVHGEDD